VSQSSRSTSGRGSETPKQAGPGSFGTALIRPWRLVQLLLWLVCLAVPAAGQPGAASDSAGRFSALPGTGFEQAVTRLLQPDEIYGKTIPDLDHHLAFTAVYLEGTSWNASRVVRHVRKTARILAPCGIELSAIRLLRARVSRALRNVDVADKYPGSDMPQNVYNLAALLPKNIEWPVLFFVGRIDGEKVLARSYQQGDVAAAELKHYPYMNTAWIAYRAHWVERPEDEYSAVAHEVAHLLCRCGHEQGAQRHLLHEFRNFLGAHVLQQHCELFRRSNLVTSAHRHASQ
jgi:hypothetical protein